MMFAPPQAKLVEIHSPHWKVSFFNRMAWIIGQQHRQVIGFTQGFSEDPMQNYVADPSDVENLVLQVLAEKE